MGIKEEYVGSLHYAEEIELKQSSVLAYIMIQDRNIYRNIIYQIIFENSIAFINPVGIYFLIISRLGNL